MASQWIDIPAGNDTFGGYLALPKRGKGPAIVIIQEIFGVNGHIRSVADQYAADGYVALAPDVFWRTQPRIELGYEGADRDKGIELLQKTDVAQAVADIGAAAAARPPQNRSPNPIAGSLTECSPVSTRPAKRRE